MWRRWTGVGAGFALGVAMMLGQGGVTMPADAPAATQLWAKGAPGALGETDADRPSITAFIPAANPTKTAVVIAPGGSYEHLALGYEGAEVAEWLKAHGVAAFVLKYRLGMKYHSPIELKDAQRAIRTVRANVAKYGVAKDHVGMWGFSAGGHLAATAGTQFDAGDAAAADVVERESSRPDFLVLAYPVITMQDGLTHAGSQKYLLGEGATQAEKDAMSAEMHVTKETPPTFLFSTTDDGTVPVLNSVMFYTALVKAGVPVEMHLFQHGRHGVGLGEKEPQLSVWPELLIKWMRERGYAAAAGGQQGSH